MKAPALLLSVLGMISPLAAATLTWDGGDPLNTLWTDPDNWQANTAPLANDELVFPPGLAAPDLTCSNDFPAGTSFESLLFQGTGYSVSGNALQVTGWIDHSVADGFPGTTSINVPVTVGDDEIYVANQGNLTTLVFGSTFDLAGQPAVYLYANGGVIRFNGGLLDSVGTGNLLKSGSATAILGTGATANSHASTGVYQGRWIVNGTHLAPVIVSDGATAGGTGTVDNLDVMGTFAPGDSTAINTRSTMTVSGSLNFGATGRLQVELSNPPAASDRVRATGTVFIGSGAQLELILPDPLHVKAGDVFRVIDKTSAGAIGGVNFANAPNGGTLSAGRVTFAVNYFGGTGNDLELTVQSVAPSLVTREWDGGGNNDLWSNAENWVGDDVPDAGDRLEFRPGAARLFPINDLREDLFIQSIFVTSGTYAFTGNRALLEDLEVNVSDADLEFALPLRFAGSSNTFRTVGFSGNKAFHWTSHVNKDAAPLFLEIRNFGQGPAGLRMAATLELTGAEVRLVNFSPLSVEWRPPFVACQDLIFTGGSVLVPDVPGETNAGIWNIGHVPDSPEESWPVTVTIANGLKMQPGMVRMGGGSVLRPAPAANVQQSLGHFHIVGDATIEAAAGATFAIQCGSLTADPATDLVCGVPVKTFEDDFSFQIGSGAACELFSFSKELGTTTGSLSGGGRLVCGAVSNLSSMSVTEASTLEWKGAGAGSSALDLTLGRGLPNASAGHLAGTGICRDVDIAIAASEITPGTAPGGYGTITLRRLAFDVGGSLRFDVGGTTAGVNQDRIEVLEAANYAGLTSVWIDLAPAYAPPAGTASVLVAHGFLAAINGGGFPFEGIIGGQSFIAALSLGDGNDLALVKQAVPPPLTGPAAGLPVGWLQVTNPLTGAATYHLPARGTFGLAYVIEMSTDLQNWTVAGQYLLDTGSPPTVDFTATASFNMRSQPRRFFRLRPL